MTRFALAGCVFALGFAVAPADEKSAKDLDGTYTAVALVRDGKDAPDAVVATATAKIAAGELTLKLKDKAYPAKIKLDATKTPAHIDIAPSDGPDKGRTFLGIYKIEKGELVISFAEKGDRPADFKGDAEVTLIRLKRDEPPK